MAKLTRQIDVVIDERHAFVYAQVLTDPQVSAVGEDVDVAIERLSKVASHALSLNAARYTDATDRVVSRHVHMSLPAARHGRLFDLDLQAFAACIESEDGLRVFLPQVGLQFELKAGGDLERMCAERLRGQFQIDARINALRGLTEPLTHSVDGRQVPRMSTRKIQVEFRPTEGAEPEETPELETLSAVGEDLSVRLSRRDAPRAYQRNAEVETLLDFLGEAVERSVLLVGESGVGKSAIVYEACRRILANDAGHRLTDMRVWQLSGGQLMAGMRFLGEWQERVIALVNEAVDFGVILFVENLIELLETSGNDPHARGIPGILLPHILSGDLVMMTEARPEQIAWAEKSHPGFMRALRQLPVEPMSEAMTREVLERVSFRLGRQLGVRLGESAIDRTMELVGRFAPRSGLPGPAVELVERAAATHAKEMRSGLAPGHDRARLEDQHILESYANMTGLPTELLDPRSDFDRSRVEAHFESHIFDQPEAVSAVADLITTIRAGLNSPDRPLGSLLFLGPTGVGKTQTALVLAEYLFGDRERIARFDMSEYQDPWSAARLVGRYQGEQGQLVRRVREQPFQVILLDEIEKAHSSVFDFLLQVLGEGRLTDGLGQTVRMTSAVIVMTSNLGAGGPAALGFSSRGEEATRRVEVGHYMSAVESFFRPEFVGRVDTIIAFRSLGITTARRLVERALEEAFSRDGLVRRNVNVRAEEDVLEHLTRVGFNPRYGARPLRQTVSSLITAPLAQFLASESDVHDLDLVIQMKDGTPVVELDENT